MTMDEYNSLEELEKEIYLDEMAIRLHMVLQNNDFITLYSLGDFFVEKRFSPLKWETKCIAFMYDEKKFNKFIKRFKLPKDLLIND